MIWLGCRPVFLIHLGWDASLRNLVGPVLVELRSLGDPALEKIDLARVKALALPLWRHALILVLFHNTRDQFALADLAGDNGGVATQIHGRSPERIESEICLEFLFVGTVAGETFIGQDGPDIPVEIDLGTHGQSRGERENQKT